MTKQELMDFHIWWERVLMNYESPTQVKEASDIVDKYIANKQRCTIGKIRKDDNEVYSEFLLSGKEAAERILKRQYDLVLLENFCLFLEDECYIEAKWRHDNIIDKFLDDNK